MSSVVWYSDSTVFDQVFFSMGFSPRRFDATKVKGVGRRARQIVTNKVPLHKTAAKAGKFEDFTARHDVMRASFICLCGSAILCSDFTGKRNTTPRLLLIGL